MTDEAKRAEVRGWLRKAANDLRAAEILIEGPTPLLGIAVYHCQQAAEKALKGFLVAYELRATKTHDVQSLIERAAEIEPEIATWAGAAARLTPFAVLFRDPGLDEEPDEETAREAVEDARTIVNQVLSLLPGVSKPEQRDPG